MLRRTLCASTIAVLFGGPSLAADAGAAAARLNFAVEPLSTSQVDALARTYRFVLVEEKPSSALPADIRALDLSADGQDLVVGGTAPMVTHLSPHTGDVFRVLRLGQHPATRIRISTVNRRVAVDDADGAIYVFSLDTGARVFFTPSKKASGQNRGLAISDDGALLAVLDADGEVQVASVTEERWLPWTLPLEADKRPITNLAVHSSPPQVAVARADASMTVWSPKGASLFQVNGRPYVAGVSTSRYAAVPTDMHFDKSGRRLAVASNLRWLDVFDLSANRVQMLEQELVGRARFDRKQDFLEVTYANQAIARMRPGYRGPVETESSQNSRPLTYAAGSSRDGRVVGLSEGRLTLNSIPLATHRLLLVHSVSGKVVRSVPVTDDPVGTAARAATVAAERFSEGLDAIDATLDRSKLPTSLTSDLGPMWFRSAFSELMRDVRVVGVINKSWGRPAPALQVHSAAMRLFGVVQLPEGIVSTDALVPALESLRVGFSTDYQFALNSTANFGIDWQVYPRPALTLSDLRLDATQRLTFRADSAPKLQVVRSVAEICSSRHPSCPPVWAGPGGRADVAALPLRQTQRDFYGEIGGPPR